MTLILSLTTCSGCQYNVPYNPGLELQVGLAQHDVVFAWVAHKRHHVLRASICIG